MADDQIVENDGASTEEQASQVEEKPEETPQPQPFDENRMRQIAEEAAAQAYERGRREMQSIKDSEVARARYEAQQASRRADALLAQTRQTDPDLHEKLQNTDLRSRVASYEQQQRDEIERQNAIAVIKDFENDMVDLIESFGLKANDGRINWGDSNSMSLSQRLKVIKESAKQAYKEDFDAKKAEAEKQTEAQKKKKEREESGVDEHDISPGGSGGDSDEEFQRRFNLGEIPYTKANMERINKILSK